MFGGSFSYPYEKVILVWYIYLHLLYDVYGTNVGKYIRPM